MNCLEKGIYISCQPATGDEAFYDFEFIKRFALAAEYGGAKAVRIEGRENVQRLLKILNIPIIALIKKQRNNIYSMRNITTSFNDIYDLFRIGARIIAIDFTFRESCDEKYYNDLMISIRKEMTDTEIFADVSTIEEAKIAEQCGVDYISCALTGYTEATKRSRIPNFNILKKMEKKISIPYIAEGGFATEKDIELARDCGAYGVVVGTAITRPHVVTKKLARKWSGYDK